MDEFFYQLMPAQQFDDLLQDFLQALLNLGWFDFRHTTGPFGIRLFDKLARIARTSKSQFADN